jgi:hypothetical protein
VAADVEAHGDERNATVGRLGEQQRPRAARDGGAVPRPVHVKRGEAERREDSRAARGEALDAHGTMRPISVRAVSTKPGGTGLAATSLEARSANLRFERP